MERVATVSKSEAIIAHAVPDLGEATTLGTALCGFPVELLTLVQTLAWIDVAETRRCPQCQPEVSAAYGDEV